MKKSSGEKKDIDSKRATRECGSVIAASLANEWDILRSWVREATKENGLSKDVQCGQKTLSGGGSKKPCGSTHNGNGQS